MKRLKISLGIIAALALALTIIYFSVPTIHYNVRTVIPGKVYRSAELPKTELLKIVKQYHVKSIINLRNSHPEEQWWVDENTISKQFGIHLYNMSLPAHSMPTKQQMRALVKTLQAAPMPMLIHCKNGVDRPGLSSAIMLILDTNTPLQKALEQFSFFSGALSPSSVGKLVMPQYVAWLKQTKQKSSAANFTRWAETVY